MSGGVLNYLYCKEEINQLLEYVEEMKEVEAVLLRRGYKDVAMDTRRLIEYIETATNRIECLAKNLNPVFKAVEYALSADWAMEDIDKSVEEYRKNN